MHENNNKTSWPIIIIGCLFLLFAKIVPALAGFVFSLKDYQIFQGIAASPWVGFRNFQLIASDFHILRVFVNTMRLNLFAALFTALISAVFIYNMLRVKNRGTAFALTCAFALFALLPPVISAGYLTFTLGMDIGKYYGLLYALFEGIKLSGFVAIAAFFMSSRTGYDVSQPKNAIRITAIVLAVAGLAGLANFMTSDFDFASVLQNPTIYERSEVVDTYSYKIGLMQMNMGAAGALWVIKYLMELAGCILAAFGLFALLRHTKNAVRDTSDAPPSDTVNKIVSAVLALAVLVLCVVVMIPKSAADTAPVQINIPLNLTYIISFLLISVISAALAGLLAYPLARASRGAKIVYAAFLVPSLYSVNLIQRYLLYRSLGIVNTIFPMLLAGFLPVWMIVMYAIAANRPGAYAVSSVRDYVRMAAPAGIIAVAINFAAMWGHIAQPMLYTIDPSQFTAALAIRNVMMTGGQSLMLNLFAFVPVLLVFLAAGLGVYALRKKD